MSNAEIIAMALVKYGPTLARELVNLFQVENPSIDDWNKLFALADKSYDDYVKPVETSSGTPVPAPSAPS